MITYFRVRGFKNFRENLVFDLTKKGKYSFNNEQIRNGIINKGIIYGKNGEGKSNLGQALFDIENNFAFTSSTLNGNSPLLLSAPKGFYRTVGYAGPIVFEYRFLFGKDEIKYEYQKSDFRVITEERLTINGKEVMLYKKGNPIECKLAEAKNVSFSNMAVGTSPLFFLFNFLNFTEGSPLGKLLDFIHGMLWFRCLNQGNEAVGFPARFDMIESAIIRANKVQDFQVFLHNYGIDYQLEVGRLVQPKGFVVPDQDILLARFGEEKAPLSQLLSTGSISLELFYYWSLLFDKVTFLFIDEFDAFYHYELSANIVSYLNSKKNFQSFVTTHNTSLMNTHLMRPDTLFLIHNNKIKPLCDCTDGELREGHNLEKIYKEGGFDD